MWTTFCRWLCGYFGWGASSQQREELRALPLGSDKSDDIERQTTWGAAGSGPPAAAEPVSPTPLLDPSLAVAVVTVAGKSGSSRRGGQPSLTTQMAGRPDKSDGGVNTTGAMSRLTIEVDED